MNFLFNILHPKKGANFISRKYNTFLHKKGIEKMNEINSSKRYRCKNSYELHGGGGNIMISEIGSITGKSFGFNIDAISEYAYMFGNIRGVMGMSDAKKLAEHILSECEKNGKTEGENIREYWKHVINNENGEYDDGHWCKFREEIKKIK